MNTPYTGTLTPWQQRELIELLWQSLKQDSEHKDRKQTGYGTKTQTGLLASIESIMNRKEPNP